jgi:23S rRNA pseudouridine1911/1915/1917 synthase
LTSTEKRSVIYEDGDLLVIDKPAGLVCHPTRDGEMSSLIGRVRLHLGSTEGRLVNRLDRETSGVVLIAKSATVARELGNLVARSEAVEKKYWAIVHGHLQDQHVVIDAPLGRDERSQVAIKDCVREDGAAARTSVDVVKRLERDGEPFTWVDVTPATGRKHQIRIHLAHIGHPIVGDKIYGRDELIYLRFVTNTLTDADRRALVVEHHALHARSLAFEWRGRHWIFEAPANDAWLKWS